MMKMTRKKQSGILAVAVALLCCILFMSTGETMAANIKVGAAINLTGPASTWGQYHAKDSRIISAT